MDSLFAGACSPISTGYTWLDLAIEQKNYSSFYAHLRRMEVPYGAEEGFKLCLAAINNKLTLKAILALLDHCPPVSQMIPKKMPKHVINDMDWLFLGSLGLVETAAAQNRADILEVLLQRGGNVNLCPPCTVSPLEAALDQRALDSLKVLMEQPGLNTDITKRILNEWRFIGLGDTMLDFCIQAIAPRMLGWDPLTLEPEPIPDSLTHLLAAEAGNWELFMRICRERGGPGWNRAKLILTQFSISDLADERMLFGEENPSVEVMHQGNTQRAAALDLLLTMYPALLKGQRACAILVALVLGDPVHAGPVLAPWIERIKKRRVSLLSMNLKECRAFEEVGKVLELWQKHLPNGPTPVLDSRMLLSYSHDCFFDMAMEKGLYAKVLQRLFHTCPVVRRRSKPGEISNLAMTLLCYGSPDLVEEQLRPGGLLAGEQPAVLREFCADNDKCPYINRAALLVHLKEEVTYEL